MNVLKHDPVAFFVTNLGIQYVLAQSDPDTKAKMLEAQRKTILAGKLGVTAAFGEEKGGGEKLASLSPPSFSVTLPCTVQAWGV
jgi:hypothetical protein